MTIRVDYFSPDGNWQESGCYSSLRSTIVEATLDVLVCCEFESVRIANNFAVVDIGIGRIVIGYK